ncbi:uncharacterized protein LOC114381508 isoform X1 [Glycine soja]|uniref:uncharacterized protein LOC114381508 isoform X1 n=1 Tax=Glycine soja TaxID=3848 RepID=UPI00103A828F|nr:uncharacterized protein LOC114381508 isoform X1 [Glycine soja]
MRQKSEVAGLGVGAVLLCATVAATKVDAFFSSSQRRSLNYNALIMKGNVVARFLRTKCSFGMCKRCGNLRQLACSTCKGTRSIREGGILGIKLVEDLYETIGNSESKVKQIACVKCQAKGYFSCPNCSEL